jgi:integrase
LGDPEKVKEFIANLQCSDGYKDNLIDAYSHYAKFCSIQWTKPKYMREERITRVPKEEDINKIISHAKLKSASAYSVIRDTGLRPIELGMLKVRDIDVETGELYPITAKHGSGRVLKMRSSTLAMLKKYLNESIL